MWFIKVKFVISSVTFRNRGDRFYNLPVQYVNSIRFYTEIYNGFSKGFYTVNDELNIGKLLQIVRYIQHACKFSGQPSVVT